MTRSILAAAALLALAGCGSMEVEDSNVAVAEGETAQQLAALPEGQRNATLFRAIEDAGRDCARVTASRELPAIDGAPVWEATCDDGNAWKVVLGRDGVATVTNAVEMGAN